MATNPASSNTVVVDDTNPALVYSGVWISSGSTKEFNGTTHGSRLAGSSVKFTFRGTSVAVYGTVGTDTPTSSYALDGTSSSIYAPGRARALVYQNLFYNSPTLADGEHTLLITNLGTGVVWIDYILYTPSVAPQPISSSSLPSVTPSLSPTFTSTLTPTPTPSKKPVDTSTQKPSSTSSNTGPGTGLPSQPDPNNKSSLSIPAVAGGAIGALILIVLLIFGMLYYRKRAKRLAGAKLLEKKNVLGDPSEFDKTDPGAAITPFTSTYASSPHTTSSYGSSNTNMYPPGSAYPPSDYGYQNQTLPSTPIYHFSNHYALPSGYGGSSDNTTSADHGPGYGGVGHMGSQYGGTHYEYTNPNGQTDYFRSPHPQYDGAQQYPSASSDTLTVPRRRSIGSAESHTSLAYLSGDRAAMDPSAPLPDALPGPPPTPAAPQRTGKGGLIVRNDTTPELRQHEDGGVRLDAHPSQDSSSQQQQVIDLPPVYKPNY